MSKRQPKRTLGKAEIARLCDDSEEIRKAQAAAPSWKDIESAFPEGRLQTGSVDESGRFVEGPGEVKNFHIEDHTPDKRRLRLLNEMFKEKCHRDADIGQKRNARHREVVMRDPNGQTRFVREEHEERVAKKVGSRRVRSQRFAGLDTWQDAQGRKWVRRPGETEWRPMDG